jgi:hypothetical protein
MDSELVVLASVAAATVIQIMTTDAWDQAKVAVAGLWRRVQPDQASSVAESLDAARQDLLVARRASDEQVELDLVAEWRTRFRRLLTAYPQLEEEVRGLVAELADAAASASARGEITVTNQATVTGRGRVYQAGRDQYISGK